MLIPFYYLILICSRLNFISWLQNHLLPCPFKYITGIDCPGCGFQRAFIALIEGNFRKSFLLYPPTVPLLLLAAYILADGFYNLDNSKSHLKKTLFMIVGSFILISYLIKMWNLYRHYNGLT